MASLNLRKFLKPILTISALICAFAGILLFFRIKTITILHLSEILGLVMLMALLGYLVLNKTPLIRTYGPKICLGLLIISTLGVLAFMENRLTNPGKMQNQNMQINGQDMQNTEQNLQPIAQNLQITSKGIQPASQTMQPTAQSIAPPAQSIQDLGQSQIIEQSSQTINEPEQNETKYSVQTVRSITKQD